MPGQNPETLLLMCIRSHAQRLGHGRVGTLSAHRHPKAEQDSKVSHCREPTGLSSREKHLRWWIKKKKYNFSIYKEFLPKTLTLPLIQPLSKLTLGKQWPARFAAVRMLSPPKFPCWEPTSRVVALAVGLWEVIEFRPGHDRGRQEGISVLKGRRDRRGLLPSLLHQDKAMWGHNKKALICQSGRGTVTKSQICWS